MACALWGNGKQLRSQPQQRQWRIGVKLVEKSGSGGVGTKPIAPHPPVSKKKITLDQARMSESGPLIEREARSEIGKCRWGH